MGASDGPWSRPVLRIWSLLPSTFNYVVPGPSQIFSWDLAALAPGPYENSANGPGLK